MNNYKELKVWQKSVDLAERIYKVTRNFPREEMYGITSQIRRSAVSVSSSIAEGAGRNSKKDFNNFLGIAYGSTCELETQLIVASRVKFLEQNDLEYLQQEIIGIQKMIWALRKSLNNQKEPGTND